MLKLKNLFPNIDLATMIVKNWDYDNLDYFKYWRISANAIYPFTNGDDIYYLRISPVEEKSENLIKAEVEFLQYLKDNNYTAIVTELSKNDKELEKINTPWGEYNAVVFKKVSGKSLENIEITNDVIHLYGKSLGRLHKLSQTYKPMKHKRNNYLDVLDWVRNVLFDYPNETDSIKELEILKELFSSLPITDDNYGLIHYDFEFDNVFYDEVTKNIIPIDFDDAMYHWYAMDVERAINSIKEGVTHEESEEVVNNFLDGYRSEYKISEDMISMFPLFHRFANLYGYARILRSVKEEWDNEPEWLVNLRTKLNNTLNKRKSFFCNVINKHNF